MRAYLIDLRKKSGLTQNEVAERLGISRAFYGMIETSARNPTLDLANRIAEFYNSNLNDIFFDPQASNCSTESKGFQLRRESHEQDQQRTSPIKEFQLLTSS